MRCYTVLLACGWLWLTAPEKPDGSFEMNRPLREWRQEQFFDTAQNCNSAVPRIFLRLHVEIETKRQKEIELELGGNPGDFNIGIAKEVARRLMAEGPTPEQKMLQQREKMLGAASRCIPSDLFFY